MVRSIKYMAGGIKVAGHKIFAQLICGIKDS